MKSTLAKSDRDDLVSRVNLLNEASAALWGKMNVVQMVKHCILWEEMVLHNVTYNRVFIGRIFGKMALKNVLKESEPLRRNSPTIPAFIISEKSGDITTEKIKWTALIDKYGLYTNDHFIHPFFGKMTKEQVGILAYKHIDHHLRQFGV